mgnify:CR=1 FL=1
MAERVVDNYLGHLLGQAHHALYRDFDEHVRAAGLSNWRNNPFFGFAFATAGFVVSSL